MCDYDEVSMTGMARMNAHAVDTGSQTSVPDVSPPRDVEAPQ